MTLLLHNGATSEAPAQIATSTHTAITSVRTILQFVSKLLIQEAELQKKPCQEPSQVHLTQAFSFNLSQQDVYSHQRHRLHACIPDSWKQH